MTWLFLIEILKILLPWPNKTGFNHKQGKLKLSAPYKMYFIAYPHTTLVHCKTQ